MKKSLYGYLIISMLLVVFQVHADITKTVGNTGGDFTTLKSAFDAINNNTDGLYTGVITLQIVDNTIETDMASLNSSVNWTSVTIYPTVTGKTISGDLSNSLIFLSGANNVTIDGRLNGVGTTRDLTITNTGGSTLDNAVTIRFNGNASNNTVKYCTIKGSGTAGFRGTILFANATMTNGNSNNIVSNNLITCADNAKRPVNSIYSDTGSSYSNANNSILNNEFADFLSPTINSSAILLQNTNTGWTIRGNSFYETTTFQPSLDRNYSIIRLSSSNGTGFVVSDNYIGGSSSSCGGTPWVKSNTKNNAFAGIDITVGGSPASSVQNNTIRNISWENAGNAQWSGILATGTSVNIGTETGNTIGSDTGTGSLSIKSGAASTIYGISITDNGNVSCSNNKVGSITVANNGYANTFYGIYISGSGISTISNNLIGSTNTSNSISVNATVINQYVYGIRNAASGKSDIRNNQFSGITNNGTTGSYVYGIYIGSCLNDVYGNYITNLNTPNSTYSAATTIIGISITSAAASSTNTYYNNVISLTNNVDCNIYGLYDNSTVSSTVSNTYFNTIYIGGVQSSGATTKSYCIRFTVNNNTKNIKNNLLTSYRGTPNTSSKHYALMGSVTSGTLNGDYNDYYVSGDASKLGNYGGVDVTSLPIITAQDANSKTIEPGFFNAGGQDANDYIPSPTVTTLTGTSGTGVTTDYAGVTRSTPNMGAFESAFVSTAQNISGLTLTANSSLTVLSGGHLTIDESKTLNTITVERGGKLTNASGQTLTLSTLNLKSDASGTATYVDNGTSTITTANVQQYLTGGRNWYITSPVASSPRNVITNATYVYKFDEPTLTWPTENTTLSPLVGYIAATTSTGTVTFTGGTLNTGIQTLTNLSWSSTDASKKGFNLMGNPYPSYLDWEQTTKTGLSTTMWYRSRNAGNTAYVFDTYNATNHQGTSLNGSPVTQYIPPMQAFWVRATSATNTFTANNTMRSHESGTNRLKAKSTDTQQVLRLVVSNGSNFDETLVLFNESAQNGFDDYDSPKMSNNTISIPEIYTQVGEQKLVMNGMNAVKYETEIPLGFATGEANKFNITNTQMSNFEVGTRIILKDKVLNAESDLTDGTPYTFESEVGNSTDRFSLVFRAPGNVTGNENSTKLNVHVFVNTNNQITIIAPEKANYSVYNLLGLKVNQGTTITNRTVVNNIVDSGVYVVVVSEKDKDFSTRILLNRK